MSIVSVIICCYNSAKYLSRCFDSLLSQHFNKLEVIFVDDGSLDNSYQIAKSYIEKFNSVGSKLVLLQQKNMGAGYAAALALKHVTGEYVMCFDTDDYLYPDSIYDMFMFLDTYRDYSVVRTNGYKVKAFNKFDDARLFVVNEKEKLNNDIFYDLIYGRTNNWAGSYLVRTASLWNRYKDHKMLASRYGQNLQILAIAAYKNKSGFIDKPLMQYINNEDSFTNKDKSYTREIELLDNFQCIRVDILKFLDEYDIEKAENLSVLYMHKKLDVSLSYGKKDEFLYYYKILRTKKKNTLEEKLNYFTIKKRRFSYILYSLIIKSKNYYSHFKSHFFK